MTNLPAYLVGYRPGFDVSKPAGFRTLGTWTLSSSLARAIASRPVPTRPYQTDLEPDQASTHRILVSETAEPHLLDAALSRAPARDAHTRGGAHMPASGAPPLHTVEFGAERKAPRRGWDRPGHGNEEVTSMQDERTPVQRQGADEQLGLGVCLCGCGEYTGLAKWTDRSKGIIKGTPLRYLRGHHHRTTVAPVCGYVVDADTGCWIWRLAIDKRGYGRTKRAGKTVHAHIAMWTDRNGPVPDGLELDHLCRNPPCCNPAHLEAVTPTENKRRSRATKLTAADVAAIKASHERNVDLARRYGVAPSNISHIRRGFSWGDVNAA